VDSLGGGGMDSLGGCGMDSLSRCGMNSLSRCGMNSLGGGGMDSLSMCGLLVFGSFRSWCFVRRLCVDIRSTSVNHVLLGFFLVRFGNNLFVLCFCLGLLVNRLGFDLLVDHCGDRFRDGLWLGLHVMNLRHNYWLCGLGFFMFDLRFCGLRLLVDRFFGLLVNGNWFFFGRFMNGLLVLHLGYRLDVDRLGFDLFVNRRLMYSLSLGRLVVHFRDCLNLRLLVNRLNMLDNSYRFFVNRLMYRLSFDFLVGHLGNRLRDFLPHFHLRDCLKNSIVSGHFLLNGIV
jgi:hypothetical protein